MSFIRTSSDRQFSDSTDDMYVYPSGIINWKVGNPSDPEDLCEVMFRILEQGGVEVNLEMVNAAHDRMELEPLESL